MQKKLVLTYGMQAMEDILATKYIYTFIFSILVKYLDLSEPGLLLKTQNKVRTVFRHFSGDSVEICEPILPNQMSSHMRAVPVRYN